MNRTLFFLSLVISSASLDDPRIDPFEVRSPNRRFRAEVRVVASDPRMARTDPRVELEVVEVREDGERRRQWSGLYPFREKKAAHFLTDDGSAFVCVDARAATKSPLVVVVRKGLTLASFDAAALGIGVPSGAEDAAPWIEPSAETCRLRATPQGLNVAHACDLLGRDGTLWTIDLSSGALATFAADDVASRGDSGAVTVEPSCQAGDARAGEPVYVNSWAAPAMIVVGDALDVSLRGYYPTPGWTLLGFELQGETTDPRSVTLVPLATRGGGGGSAQVTRPFEVTARVLGLTEGVHRIGVRGRGGPPALEVRNVEVLPRGMCARLVERDASRELVAEIVLYTDGRLRAKDAAGSRFLLAREDGYARALELVALMDPREASPRPSDPASRTFELCWVRDRKPERVAHDESTLQGTAGDLVAVLLDLVAAPSVRIAHYQLDRDASRFFVQTSSSGLLSAFGHDHKIEIAKYEVDLEVNHDALEKSSLAIKIDASSLAVVDKDSAKDAPEIEREMRDKVLQVGRHPEIVFKSTRLSVEPAGPGVFAIKITGDLSLNGKTRSITVPARIEMRDAQLTARGEFSIRQTDYGIEPVSAAAGTVNVADKIKLTFDLRMLQE